MDDNILVSAAKIEIGFWFVLVANSKKFECRPISNSFFLILINQLLPNMKKDYTQHPLP